MPIPFPDILRRLLQRFADNIAAHKALAEHKPDLSLEDLRAQQRIRLEQSLARERRRLDASLARPFNGLL